MSKRKPRRWKVSKPSASYVTGGMMYRIDGPELVRDFEDWGFTEADARLIAAAPELLEALRELEESTDWTWDNRHRVKARAAIAKAEGKE